MVATWSMLTPRRRSLGGGLMARLITPVPPPGISLFTPPFMSGLMSAPGPVDGLDARAGAQRRGDVGQVAGVLHLDVEIDVEEVRMAVAHVDPDDVAAGLADDRAGLAHHAGRVADGGVQAGVGEGVALRLG